MRNSWISQTMCLPCLIIIQSSLFRLKNKETFHMYVLAALSVFCAPFTWSRRTTCAKDHGLLSYKPQINNDVGNSYHMEPSVTKVTIHLHLPICHQSCFPTKKSSKQTVIGSRSKVPVTNHIRFTWMSTKKRPSRCANNYSNRLGSKAVKESLSPFHLHPSIQKSMREK